MENNNKAGNSKPDKDRELLKAFDEALENGPWQKSAFLKNVGAKLKSLRDLFVREAHLEPTAEEHQAKVVKAAKREEQTRVFVSLYCSTGQDIKSWEKLLATMSKQVITRPIYENEDHVRELIRSKVNKNNEAYIIVYIDKGNFLKPIGGKFPKDLLGHTLLVVREGSMRVENVEAFVHKSGLYHLKEGKLTRQGDVEF